MNDFKIKYQISVRNIFYGFGWTVVVLAIFIAIFVFYRLHGITPKERTVLALMHKNYHTERGINAFPLLFYLYYDVPSSQLDAQMIADVGKVRKRLKANGKLPIIWTERDADVPLLPEVLHGPLKEDGTVLCDVSGKGCLAKVIAHPNAVRAAVDSYPVISARVRSFIHADFYRDEFPADWRSPIGIGEYGQKLWLSTFALKYAKGNHASALAETCQNIAAWRRMARTSNVSAGTAILNARLDSTIRLYADMLTGLRADEAVPEDCSHALQPIVAADVDLCAQSAREFMVFETMFLYDLLLNSKANLALRFYGEMILDPHKTLSWTAQNIAASCGDDAIAHFLADERPRRKTVRSFLSIPMTEGLACISNILGCRIIAAEIPMYEGYDAATLDRAAHLRLAATLLWLRKTSEGSEEDRFARRPVELRSLHHSSGIDTKHGVLYVDNFYESTGRDTLFELPLAFVHTQVQ